MKIILDITNAEDILWLENMGKDRRGDTVRNCITIGRLSLEHYQFNIDGSKNLQPIIQQFRDEMSSAVDRTLESVSESVQSIQKTKDELINMSMGMRQQLDVNTNTMIESVKSQQNITEKIIDPITTRIDKMNEEVEKIFSIKGTSNSKGKLGESLISGHIQTAFPHYEVTDMSYNPHEADYHITTEFGKVLLEIKTYTASVNKEQIEKLYKDIDRTGLALAIFLSTTSGIVGKKNIEWEIYGKNKTIILFFPNSGLAGQGIVFSFLFLKALVESGINKENSNTFYKSDEEIQTMLQMFDEFYSDLVCIGEKQSKLRYEISTVKNTIDKLLDDLYKQSFELELDQKRSLEKMYGKIKEKLSIKGKSLDTYQWIDTRLEFTGWLESLILKTEFTVLMNLLYDKLETIESLTYCYPKERISMGLGPEKQSTRLLVVDSSNKKVLCESIINKTKIDIVFELPKTFNGSVSIIPRYESMKGSEITITLLKTPECYEIIRDRIIFIREMNI